MAMALKCLICGFVENPRKQLYYLVGKDGFAGVLCEDCLDKPWPEPEKERDNSPKISHG